VGLRAVLDVLKERKNFLISLEIENRRVNSVVTWTQNKKNGQNISETTVQWLGFPIGIQGVLCSNLEPNNGYQ
jgi:hypothetical protein